MSNPLANDADIAQRAWDHLCIIDTLSRVAHAQDNLDPVSYRKCFTDMVLLKEAVMFPGWTEKEIPADQLTAMTFENLGKGDAGHHMVFNHLIDVSGDEASCVADLYAVTVFIHEDKTSSSAALGGRYHLKLRRQAGQWLICERAIKVRYRTGDQGIYALAQARAARKAEAGGS